MESQEMKGAKKAGRPKGSGNGTRDELLESARIIFAEVGYETAKVSDIVADSNVSQGTFYYHFDDKKAVLVELLESSFAEIIQIIDEWAETRKFGPEIIRTFAENVARIIYENSEIVQIMKNEENNRDAEINCMIKDFYSYIYEKTAAGFELGLKMGFVRQLDTHIASVGFVGMIKEIVMERIDSKEDLDRDNTINEIISLINYGIRKPASGD